jgi:protein-disulfide isomerase
MEHEHENGSHGRHGKNQGHGDRHETKHESKAKHHHNPHQEPKAKGGMASKYLRWLVVLGVIQAILLFVVAVQLSSLGGGVVANTADGNAPAAAAPAARPSAPTPVVDMKALVDDDAVKGDPNAPVTIVEFSDYECPFCARFYSQTLSQIDAKYIQTGKVKLVYRDFPLSFHQQAQKAGEAAECAGEQGKYFEMHDKLFESGVTGGVASFKQYAADLGLNTADFNTCLDSGAQASEVQKDFRDGQAAGVQGTPGFIVNGQLVSGAQPFSVFEQIIEAELAS